MSRVGELVFGVRRVVSRETIVFLHEVDGHVLNNPQLQRT